MPTPDALPILVFDCSGCCACCLHMGRPPFVGLDDPEWDRLAAERPDLAAEITADMDARPMATEDDSPCLWLDLVTKRCKHHDYRPGICADFDAGSWYCLEHRHRRGMGPDPGPEPGTT